MDIVPPKKGVRYNYPLFICLKNRQSKKKKKKKRKKNLCYSTESDKQTRNSQTKAKPRKTPSSNNTNRCTKLRSKDAAQRVL